MNIHSGYCTNVHAGADLVLTRDNLQRHAVSVRSRLGAEPLGIGLWLSAYTARNLRSQDLLAVFANWLRENKLDPFTLNGFPFGDFHQTVVKHRVYEPTWYEDARADYTRDLIAILHELLPAGREATISTLPIAWGTPAPSDDQLLRAATALDEIALDLARLEQSTGRLMHVCLEPEPGCYLQRSTDIVRFFEEYLLPGRDEHVLRRHLRVCHDVCHAAVMFEEQEEVLQRYRTAGLLLGKVQVSSAVAMSLAPMPPDERAAAVRQLAGFDEPRYLHQTMVQEGDGQPTFFEDLHLALATEKNSTGEWRVHFHVPIYLRTFGRLQATQDDILRCLKYVRKHELTNHFEIETYAWGVLPPELQHEELAAGIAEEMRWFRETWTSIE